MFNLKRPCANCPFRKGQGELFQIPSFRLRQIVEAVAFQCHKTVDYSGDQPDQGDKPQQCAGLMAVLHRSGRHNQIMQVAMRLGYLRPEELDPDGEAYGSIAEALEAHALRATTPSPCASAQTPVEGRTAPSRRRAAVAVDKGL